MRCSNCHSNNWENVDFARIKPSGMSVCKDCGFVSYPAKWKTPEEIKAHYRSDYRPPPTTQNIFAGERKNHFHHAFLAETFEKWRREGKESPRICEIGAAFGFALQWFRKCFPKADVTGTELTTSFRRNAFHEFGVTLTEDIDESKKYDMIMSYKVLEHQLDPDKELRRYRECLSGDGLFYISVPTWFNSMFNFGLPGFDVEYYYDPNHINVWTKEIFKGMLETNGFEIIKEDQVIYSSTYLCKKGEFKTATVKHNAEEIKSHLTKIRAAYMFFTENKFDEAIAQWPDYPQAHISKLEMSRKDLKEKGWESFKKTYIMPMLDACTTSAEAMICATDFAMRAEMWNEAIHFAETALLMKPENPQSLHQLSNIMREMAMRAKDNKTKAHYFAQAREVAVHLRNVSTQHFKEATDLIYLFNSKFPCPSEIKNVPIEKPALVADRPPEASP